MRAKNVKYIHIYDILKEKIVNGEFPIGSQFPTETELQSMFGASRITVRHSVQMLVDDGYLKRIPGIKTIVVSQKESLQLKSLISFTEQYKNENPVSVIIDYKKDISPSALVSSRLNLAQGEKVSFQERVRTLDDLPISHSKVYIPSSVQFTEEELSNPRLSLYSLLEQKGHNVLNAEETIEVTVADAQLGFCCKVLNK